MGFFAKLKGVFEAPETKPEGLDPAAVALAALMVRLAKADGVFDEAEQAALRSALDARFGDQPGGGGALMAAGEAAEADALDHHQFTRLLKHEWEHEERAELLEDLWVVVLADGEREAHENALMRQIGSLLHVSDQEVQMARRRVEAR